MTDVWLSLMAGVILGETLAVLTIYMRRGGDIQHVVLISASYLILIVLAMQPAVTRPLGHAWHVALAILAFALGTYGLWLLLPGPEDREADP